MIARFSNTDSKNWMKPDGSWWYDLEDQIGVYDDPLYNRDAISAAFWLLKGTEFKVTRTDDVTHTALLKTKGECLRRKTFRSKITGYGNFRNGAKWSHNKCLGACSVTFGGQFASTDGFKYASHSCSSDIGGAKKINFWCDWGWDASVMMIGKGGSDCGRSDHGLGVTEEDYPRFSSFYARRDFSNSGHNIGAKAYGLNLWIR